MGFSPAALLVDEFSDSTPSNCILNCCRYIAVAKAESAGLSVRLGSGKPRDPGVLFKDVQSNDCGPVDATPANGENVLIPDENGAEESDIPMEIGGASGSFDDADAGRRAPEFA